MRKWYSSTVRPVLCFSLLLTILATGSLQAQTTLTTLPNPPYNGGNSLGSPSNIAFVLNNTNPFGVNLTAVSNWCNTTENNSVWQLYYSATSLSGTSTDVTAAPWTLVATSGPTPVAANGITALNFTGLNFTIPASTQYRFVLRNTGPGNTRYSGLGGAITPNNFTGGGVTLLCGDSQIGGVNVGYSGTGTALTLTPRYFTGAVTFIPAGPCVNPPVPGTVSSTATTACLNVPFTLSLTGGTGGTGQTYQWQISPDNITWTDIPGANSASLTTSQSSANYYHCVVTCGVSVTSNSIQIQTPSAVSGTFTINSALPTGGTNFQSFNAAYDYIKCGINGPVIFNVDPASGPYNEQLIMTPVPGASAVNTVTFNGNGRTLAFLSTNTNERAVIKLNGADHIKFNNLVINALGSNATTEFGFGVQLLNDADSNAVTNSTININDLALNSTGYAGIVMSASATSATTTGNTLSDGNVFTGNTINGGYYGITCVGSTTAANRDNIISGNTIRDFFFYGIYILGNFNTQIDSNHISRPTRSVVNATCNGIFMSSLNVSVNITRNTITNPFGGAPGNTGTFNGIFITGVDALSGVENKVINNKIYGLNGNGEANGINNTGSDNVWIQHNTILMDGDVTGTALTRGFFQTTTAAGVRFENNIVSITRTGTAAKYGLYHATVASDIYSDDNVIYLNPAAGNTNTGFYNGAAQATLLDWQTASTDDANSFSTNPIFQDVSTGNLKPTNASIDNQAAPVGILIDILGLPRSATTPDIGAYEFTPGNCAAPPTPGNAIANPQTVCENFPASLSVTGNSIGLTQTYQWQTAAAIGGPYTNIGNVLTNPDSTIIASITQYYRLAVTCGGSTTFSEPVLVTVTPAFSGTYTINSALPTGGTNFQTFAAAKAALSCGINGPVVFNVVAASGPYNEQLILGPIAGSSATNTITFNGNNNILNFSSNDGNERAVIKLRGAKHFIFNNLVIDATGPGTFGFGVHILNNADSNKIQNCRIENNQVATTTNYAGIVISGTDASATGTTNSLSDDNLIDNNTIVGGYYGITVVGLGTSPVLGNIISNNRVEDFYFYGIYISGTQNTVLDGNTIQRPTRSTVTTGYGIYATGLSTNMLVARNRITKLYGAAQTNTTAMAGIYFTGVDAITGAENMVVNNLVYGNSSEGIQYGIYNSSSDFVKYYHNTIALDDNQQTGNSATYGFYQTLDATDIEFKNNIVFVKRSGVGNKFGLFFNSTTSTIASNYNNIYLSGSNTFTGFSGGNQANLTAWQAATTQDANSSAFDPLFSNPSAGNYSPLFPGIDNTGTPLGIGGDILNNPRSATTPDMGAYEFAIPPCTAPPAAGNANANPSSGICIEYPVDLTLQGYVFGSGQTYQWEYSTSATGPWLPLGGPRLFPDTTILATGSFYYHCLVTCSGNTAVSTTTQVTLNPAFLAGTYTINSTIPPSTTNFTSFNAAVAALECGITGPVFFDVAPNTYDEQVRMHKVPGSSPTARVTFRSANGDPASVILNWDIPDATRNYVLKLDSASHITYMNMTIQTTNPNTGRVIELANLASKDSIVNCRLNMPAVTTNSNNVSGIFADNLRGGENVIYRNRINGGSHGMYFEGTAAGNYTSDNVIDSNTIENNYAYGMWVGFNARVRVSNNIVNMTDPRAATTYGIYSTNSDSAYQYTGNRVTMTRLSSTTSYGMYFTGCDANTTNRGRIAGNLVNGLQDNTGNLYGMYQTGSNYNNTVNNVTTINTSGATSYSQYITGSGGVNFQNNSVLNASSSATNNFAAFLSQTSGALPSLNIQNNVIAHLNGGRAASFPNLNFIFSDYNLFYTTGTTLITQGTLNYATLPAWINASYWDVNSISYAPAFASTSTLQPDLASPEVWAMHGRGTQIAGNDYDFNNNPRPTTFTTGVPDLGAYEFLPTSLPTVLTATPAAPAPGITQTFMYGTDTVAKVTYDAAAPVPSSVTLRRYSGVLPTGLSTGQQSMYFYTQLEVPAQGAYKYKMEQFYIDPWKGFIPTEPEIKMGRTDAAGAWAVYNQSLLDLDANTITDTGIVFIDRYTGLAGDSSVTQAPPYTTVIDTSNRGTRFWVPYGHHYSFSSNGQDMWLYLSAEDSANVTVKVNGTSWKRTYAIPANTVRVSDLIPKYGLIDARITDEGLFDRGISITSDVPIVAYAHIYDGATSGATMLMPVGVYGYEYRTLNSRQYYPSGGAGSYSWFAVMTDRDSTLVEITPAVATKAGRPAGVPFQVYLMKGQVYNVMGTQATGGAGTDMSGSTVKSIANASGKCFPIAVFSGSSRTAICNTTNGDNLIQQNFPSQAWGKKYLTFATANTTSNTQYNSNIFRIMVKDAATVVTYNGTVLNQASLTVPGNYYEVSTSLGNGPNGAVYIEADKPVMVAQYMVSTGANQCPGVSATGNGDPEMIYISPIEQGIDHAAFYNTNESAITNNYVNVVVPTAGLGSLTIDGSSTFTDVFAHPFLAGYSCVRQNLGATPGQHIVDCDSAFTAITYGLGSVESYGYNAGTLVKNLNALPNIQNTLGQDSISNYTCVNAPFRFNILITAKPQVLTWQFSSISSMTPNTDVIQNNPAPIDSSFINGRWYYKYTVATDYVFSQAGTYQVPILVKDTASIEGCENTQEVILTVTVIDAPVADFSSISSGCYGAPITFNGTGTTANNTPINTWNWDFGNSNNGTGQTTTYTYPAPGTYNVTLNIVAADGCVADTTKSIVVNAVPAVDVVEDSLVVCGNASATFEVLNPDATSTYDWFTTATGGTSIFTGPTFTTPAVTGTVEFWVQSTSAAGCISERRRVVANILPDLAVPVARVDSVGTDRIRFAWDAVPGAVTYEVSTDNGATWSTPSSGPSGLTHTVTGLLPLQTVSLIVRANGTVSCQVSVSAAVEAKTLPDQIYIPNAFTPNGDGLNDVLLVYGYTITTMRFAVFNQWGEKIFESSNQAVGWDGRYKGKPQPSGVYMYVCQLVLRDGTTLTKKGSINLVR